MKCFTLLLSRITELQKFGRGQWSISCSFSQFHTNTSKSGQTGFLWNNNEWEMKCRKRNRMTQIRWVIKRRLLSTSIVLSSSFPSLQYSKQCSWIVTVFIRIKRLISILALTKFYLNSFQSRLNWWTEWKGKMRLVILDTADSVGEWGAKYVLKRIRDFNPGPNKWIYSMIAIVLYI